MTLIIAKTDQSFSRISFLISTADIESEQDRMLEVKFVDSRILLILQQITLESLAFSSL